MTTDQMSADMPSTDMPGTDMLSASATSALPQGKAAPVDRSRDASLDLARALLKERQGLGARYDSADAPHDTLLWARRGTAFFARALCDLTDEELYQPSLLPGWTRAHVVAHVAYNARALARLLQWARTGEQCPMYASLKQRNIEIERGSSLPPRALRHLFDHSAVHLDVEWRDLPQGHWDRQVTTIMGRSVPVSQTAWMRTREVWIHAVDIAGRASGASFVDFPRGVLDRLAGEILDTWKARGEVVDIADVHGDLADVVRWLTGRGARRLTTTQGGQLPQLPRWL